MKSITPQETGLKRSEFSHQITPDALPRLAFSMKETAHILGVNYQTVYRLAKLGKLRSSGNLRTKLFARSEIERFLAQ